MPKEEMDTIDSDRFYIITGGPGSGKSTVIDALAERGISTVPEAGRAIIQDQVAIGGNALPWSDRGAFAELMLSWEMRSYRMALALSGPVIFDRGVPDVAGLLALNRATNSFSRGEGRRNVSLSSPGIYCAAMAGDFCSRLRTKTIFR
jgi:predicted ATPase